MLSRRQGIAPKAGWNKIPKNFLDMNNARIRGVICMERRDFIKLCAAAAAAGTGLLGVRNFLGEEDDYTGIAADDVDELKEAYHYSGLENGEVLCGICFRECRISDGDSGFCRIRVNNNGTLYNKVYARPSAVNVDPIEKEPMHHFYPGTDILCVGTASCNFRCQFCHNWHLSQRDIDEVERTYDLDPESIVAEAQNSGAPGISFTYNEPTVFYEYMYDIARQASQEGFNVIFHTNGSMREEPLLELLKYVDGVTVDLKAFTDDFYRDVIKAEKEPVLDTLKTIESEGVWLEIVNLVLPDYNDDPDNIADMSAWVVDELNEDVPLHFSRFTPSYQMTDLSPTPVDTLERCREVALDQGVNHVTIGNVPGHEANSTFCPGCGEEIISRHHFTVHDINLTDGSCEYCGREIAGVWK